MGSNPTPRTSVLYVFDSDVVLVLWVILVGFILLLLLADNHHQVTEFYDYQRRLGVRHTLRTTIEIIYSNRPAVEITNDLLLMVEIPGVCMVRIFYVSTGFDEHIILQVEHLSWGWSSSPQRIYRQIIESFVHKHALSISSTKLIPRTGRSVSCNSSWDDFRPAILILQRLNLPYSMSVELQHYHHQLKVAAYRQGGEGILQVQPPSNIHGMPRVHLFSVFGSSLSNRPRIDKKAGYDVGAVVRGDDYSINGEPWRIAPQDLRHGGLIVGDIGMGKTVFRLGLERYLIQDGLQIIDIDVKGDLARDGSLHAMLHLQPGQNCGFNPFYCPIQDRKNEYANRLFSLMQQLFPDDFSPQQLIILRQTIFTTVETNGTLADFFQIMMEETVQISGPSGKEGMELSRDALFVRLQRLDQPVYAVSHDSLEIQDYTTSLCLDLSNLSSTLSPPELRFLVDIFLTKFLFVREPTIEENTDQLTTLVVVDEGQLLAPATHLGLIAHIMDTRRYQGMSVLMVAPRSDGIIKAMLRAGIKIQFHSSFTDLQSALGLLPRDPAITSLPPYHAIIRQHAAPAYPVRLAYHTIGDIIPLPSKTIATVSVPRKAELDLLYTRLLWKHRIEKLFRLQSPVPQQDILHQTMGVMDCLSVQHQVLQDCIKQNLPALPMLVQKLVDMYQHDHHTVAEQVQIEVLYRVLLENVELILAYHNSFSYNYKAIISRMLDHVSTPVLTP